MGLACAALFATAAWRTWRRARAPGATRLRSFAIFWLGSGAYVGADSLWSFAWIAGVESLLLGVIVLEMKVAAVCAAFAGLLVYLLSIYRPGPFVPPAVAASYLALFLALGAYYAWRSPVGAHANFASLSLDYARVAPEPVWNALLLLLFVPPIVATLAYASLLRVASHPAQRRRIALTSAALLLFFAPDLLGWISHWTWWDLAERALALGAGAMILGATPRSELETGRQDASAA